MLGFFIPIADAEELFYAQADCGVEEQSEAVWRGIVSGVFQR